jgi:hypothetical protein
MKKQKLIKINKTNRGFKVAYFDDLYHQKSSIQESSLATDQAIWLGCQGNRMHLNRQMVRELLPYLIYFAIFGRLPSK